MPTRLARFAQSSAFVLALAVPFAVGGRPSSAGNSHAPDAGSPAGDVRAPQEEIHALLDQYLQGLLNRDVATLDRIWADDLTFINPRGQLLNKQNRMENIKSGATAFESIGRSDERIRTYGQAAVATYRTTIVAQYSGQESSGDYRVTTVWARPKDMWQLVAVQMTRIAP
jgi:ketosteroid isomerase-like protein